jgi:ribosomal protein S18 acetylase RimI-like enzyme
VIAEARLADGTLALVWELLPSDREALRVGYEQLSDESRFHRFLTGVPHLTPPLLDHLVDDVDGIDHVALVLVAVDADGVGLPVGVARMIRYPDDPSAADLAVTVLDEWQGRGVATALLDELVRRRPAGVTRVVTTIAADNGAALAMVRRLGRTTVTSTDASGLDITVELDPEPPDRVAAEPPA